MPSLAQKNEQYSFGFWSNGSDDVSYNQLQKFWSELPPKARQELIKINKHMFFEQARKNVYCSRCNGLLLEAFLQIIMYGKSLQQEGSIENPSYSRVGASKEQHKCNRVVNNGCSDDTKDSSVHPWGGLATTRDGSLTLLDRYLFAKSLKGLKIVFDSARARERERELLYPDACGGGGRGWISQGMSSYGRGHGTRETCALHTARLSCNALVDFWSSLGEETRKSLLRMKEEDFIEKLMYRFDRKRFCRDCRRNVIREFKELKELKRIRRQSRCTTSFCVADTAFQYEVSIDSVRADWRQTFPETSGIYHHFEWALGTSEGKSDIRQYENVGLKGRIQVNGLDLRGLNTCYINLRAFKLDGRCSEISVKAHALKGQQCVHYRLEVGDGFVSIKKGENIQKFFERAEEAEEEEDEDMMDKDGNELDGECSRPQKHAKSPELAREFLVDAAMVIFKEQVEKSFRERTARQNAHSLFVCLALNLLEQRVYVACKEIITLEKQMKLLEEEEKEKQEEEERKERKRAKDREKKLRRKERLKEKEIVKEKNSSESNGKESFPNISKGEQLSLSLIEETNNTTSGKESSINQTGDVDLSLPGSPDNQYKQCFHGNSLCCDIIHDGEVVNHEDRNGYFPNIHPNEDVWNESQSDHGKHICSEDSSSRCFNEPNRQLRMKNSKNSNSRDSERYDSHSCSCKSDFVPDSSLPVYRSNGYNLSTRSILKSKMVWEPIEGKRYSQNKSDSDTTLKPSRGTLSTSKATEKLDDDNHKDKDREYKDSVDLTEEDKQIEDVGETQNNDWNLKYPMLSKTANSDNSSSYLSEGDNNTASFNSRNSESSSTSDFEEGTGTEVMDWHGKNINARDLIGDRNFSSLPSDNGNNMDNMVSGGFNILSHMFPQMLNHNNIQFPVFPAPPSTMSYYHQAPDSWCAAPTSELMSFQPHNRYLYASPLGHRLHEDSQLSMQYGNPRNHSANPFFNSGPTSNFHPFAKTYNASPKEQEKALYPFGNRSLKEESERKASCKPPMEFPSCGISQSDDDFSLFHFGGPVACSAGCKSDRAQSKDGIWGDFSWQFSPDHVSGNLAHKKKAKESKMEEYNLFAVTNGLRFSLF